MTIKLGCIRFLSNQIRQPASCLHVRTLCTLCSPFHFPLSPRKNANVRNLFSPFRKKSRTPCIVYSISMFIPLRWTGMDTTNAGVAFLCWRFRAARRRSLILSPGMAQDDRRGGVILRWPRGNKHTPILFYAYSQNEPVLGAARQHTQMGREVMEGVRLNRAKVAFPPPPLRARRNKICTR